MHLAIKIFKTCRVIFGIFLAFFAFRLLAYHFFLAAFPLPIALREGAMMTTTDALVKGLNPYEFSLQPQFMNQYGIVYPLLVWPWAKIFGVTMVVHRMVSGACILASCGLIFLVLKRMQIPLSLNIWAVLIFYASLLYPATSTPTIDAGAAGTLFFLLTIFIPWLGQYSYKSLMISVVCGIIGFYTKPYAFLGVFIMSSYTFLFVSKRKGVFYGCLLLALSSLTVWIISHIFPAYFDDCFFAPLNMGPAWSSMQRLQEQLEAYNKLHLWTLILMTLFGIWYSIKAVQSSDFPASAKAVLFKFPLVLYAGLWAVFVLYMSLGRHSGAMLWYFFQLLSPFVLIAAAWLFSRNRFWPLLCAPFLALNLYTMTKDHHYQWFNQKMPGWAEVYHAISAHKRILNTSLIAPLLVEQNKEVIDNGMAEYFGTGARRPGWAKFLKYDERVDIQLFLFFQKIRERVQNREFDLIILQPSLLPMGVAEDVKRYYKYEGGLELYAPQDRRGYPVTVWVPEKSGTH